MYETNILNILKKKLSRAITLFDQKSKIGYTVFDFFVEELEFLELNHDDSKFVGLKDIKSGKKLKGDIFEEFCKQYLLKIKKFDTVYLLKETPVDVLNLLGIKRQDFGIDIIAIKNGKYNCVQCKFKKPHRDGIIQNAGGYIRYNCVNFKELSTFYTLAIKTGPWNKLIVMTNTKYVRHIGRKTKQDWSICLKTFQNLSVSQIYELIDTKGHLLNEGTSKESTITEMRKARLLKFENHF